MELRVHCPAAQRGADAAGQGSVDAVSGLAIYSAIVFFLTASVELRLKDPVYRSDWTRGGGRPAGGAHAQAERARAARACRGLRRSRRLGTSRVCADASFGFLGSEGGAFAALRRRASDCAGSRTVIRSPSLHILLCCRI